MTSTDSGRALALSRRDGQALISPTGAGRRNRSHVLRTLYASGPLSRAELATAIGATKTTIGQIVQPLVDSRLLAEQDPLPSSGLGGRRARPLWFSPNGWAMAGVHLLPGSVHAALVGAGGEVLDLATHQFDVAEAAPEFIVDAICGALLEVLPGTDTEVRGVGIAVPGMVDTGEGEIVAVNLMPKLARLPLADQVGARLSLPVYLDQHPRAQALGDLLFGEGRGVSSFLSLYTGETLGAGLILDGSLHRGVGGAGGEVGHTLVNLDGEKCRCGRRGCWETIATTRWMRHRAADLGLSEAHHMTASHLVAQASDGVAEARTVLDEYRRHLAYGIADLHQTLAPELFLLHGDVAGAGEDFRAELEEEVVSLVPAHPRARPHLVLSRDDELATVRGAASVALFHALKLDL